MAKKYDISPADLLKYNELAGPRQVREGDIIFLDMKKKRYDGPQDVYISEEGETLHDVSQKFGIRLQRLARLNGIGEYVRLENGTRLILK